MTQEERYRMVLAERHNKSGSGVADFSGPIAPGVGREAIDAAVKSENAQVAAVPAPIQAASSGGIGEKAGSEMATAGAQGGNTAQTLGGMAMMSGNPYLMAGGLGLTVLAQGEQNKRAQEEKQRQEYNERIKQRQVSMAQIASMGIQ